MGGAYSMYGRDCKMLVQKAEGMRQSGRLRHSREDNIKMDLRKKGSKDMNWIHLIQDSVQQWAVVNMVMNVQIP